MPYPVIIERLPATLIGLEYAGSQLYAVVVQADGSIVGAGEKSVVRVLANGMADASFSVDGVVRFEGELYQFYDIALGPNGTIIAVGYVNSGLNFAVVRVGADGAPDQNFGVGGVVKIDFGLFGFSADYGTSVLTYANGKILVTGIAGQDFGLTRINGAAVLGNPGGPFRPGGLHGQILNHPQSPGLVRLGGLTNLVERIDEAIARHRIGNTMPHNSSPSRPTAVPTSRTNSPSRSQRQNLIDEFFAELGDELRTRAGTMASPGQFPYQVSLREFC